MTYSTGWLCPWFGGAKLDDGEACRLRRLSAARAHGLEAKGGPPVSPMLRVCHQCRAEIQTPATDTYRGTGTDTRPAAKTAKTISTGNEEGSMSNNNPGGPYRPGTCTDCGQKRSVYKKTSICRPCTMKAYNSGKTAPPIVAPSKAKPIDTDPSLPKATPADASHQTTVNLAAGPGLPPAIEAQAREELRSPAMRVLFLLREAVKGKKA